MILKVFLVLLLIKIAQSAVEKITFRNDTSLFLNDKCNLGNGKTGVCIKLNQCKSEMSFFKKNQRVKNLCSFDQSKPIVCCEPPKKVKTSQSKSVKQCLIYGRLASSPIPEYVIRVRRFSIRNTVVGGSLTLPSEFPHMAAIGWTESSGQTEWRCGGSLISKDFILTAAHCADFEGRKPDIVRISDQNLIKSSAGAFPQQFKIAKIIVHPKYKSSSTYNDIALIQINGIVIFGQNIRPACLWTQKKINSTSAWVTGWGDTEFGGTSSNELLKAELKLVDQTKCKNSYGKSRRYASGIVSSQLCAGDAAGQRDSCQGDSGGPLQIRSGNFSRYIYHVVGITSFGKACATPDEPSVYTRVSTFISWIESIVWK